MTIGASTATCWRTKRFRLSDVLVNDAQELEYVYDVGDDWRQLIKIEQVLQPQEDVNTWPMCVAGAIACPPENVGGTPGYMDFLHAMRDPANEEHGAIWLWWDGPFDPNGFASNAANLALGRLR